MNIFLSGLIQSVVFVDNITPGYGWETKTDSGPVSTFVYKYRVVCAPNYYGLNCTIFCNPRNDSHGHYGCDVNGNKYCLNGWSGISGYCTTRKYTTIFEFGDVMTTVCRSK